MLIIIAYSHFESQERFHLRRLVGEILRISAWECAALEAGLGTVFSPELSATISWLLKIWSNSYLMPQPSIYSEVMYFFMLYLILFFNILQYESKIQKCILLSSVFYYY